MPQAWKHWLVRAFSSAHIQSSNLVHDHHRNHLNINTQPSYFVGSVRTVPNHLSEAIIDKRADSEQNGRRRRYCKPVSSRSAFEDLQVVANKNTDGGWLKSDVRDCNDLAWLCTYNFPRRGCLQRTEQVRWQVCISIPGWIESTTNFHRIAVITEIIDHKRYASSLPHTAQNWKEKAELTNCLVSWLRVLQKTSPWSYHDTAPASPRFSYHPSSSTNSHAVLAQDH